jgi:hypothetical protein
MIKQQLPNIYSEALHLLTTGGTAAIKCNNNEGEIFTVETGSGQGDPPSAPRFTTGTDPLTRAIDKVTKDFRYKLNGDTLPISVFADDNMLPLCIQNMSEFEKIIEIFDDFYKVSGLKINLKKTEIMAFNTDPDLLLAIENRYGIKIVQSVTYLGIEITGTYQESKKATYSKAVSKIKEKCSRIKRAHVSMLHKKQLIKQAVIPMINHVAMSVGGGGEEMGKIDGILRDTMWTKTVKGVEISGRKMIAKKRFDMSHNMGGLQLEKVENTVRRILLNSLQRYSTVEGGRGPYSNIMLEQNLVDNGFLPIRDMFEYGPLQWKRIHESVLITPIMRDMAEAFMDMAIINEKDKEGWLSSAVVGHTIGNKHEQILRGEGELLKQAGIRMVADLFPHDEITGKLDFKNDRLYDNEHLLPHPQLIRKLKKYRKTFEKSNQQRLKPIAFHEVIKTGKFSKIFSKLKQKEIDSKIKGPPSYFTRRAQGYSLPPLHIYMGGYDNLFKLDMPLKTKETSFLILNRQTWTEQKTFFLTPERGGGVDQNCKLCGEIENTEHLIFKCPEYSMIIWDVFYDMCNEMLRKEDPNKLLAFSINNVMYAVPLNANPPKVSNALDILICEIKKDIIYRKYLRSQNPRLNNIIYTPQRISQHIEIICNRLVSLRQYQGRSTDVYGKLVEILREMF